MESKKIDWLVIDLDNTLLDFDEGARKSLELALTAFDIPADDHHIQTYKRINHQCWQAFERRELDVATLKGLRFKLFVEAIETDTNHKDLNRLYLDTLAHQVDEVRGARAFLDWAHPRFQLLLATNGFTEVQQPRLRKSGLNPYFQHVVISEEIGIQKPYAGFFDHAFDKMKNPDRDKVMMVGDGLSSDIKGGVDYGIRTCWLHHGTMTNETDIKPDHSVETLEELMGLVVS